MDEDGDAVLKYDSGSACEDGAHVVGEHPLPEKREREMYTSKWD